LIASTVTPSEEEHNFDTVIYANDICSQDEHGYLSFILSFSFRPTHSEPPWRGLFTRREDRKTNYHQMSKKLGRQQLKQKPLLRSPHTRRFCLGVPPIPFGGGRESVPKPPRLSSRGDDRSQIF